jgi:hypothetical protein
MMRMTETADPTTLSLDELNASVREFFDVEPISPSEPGSDAYPPPSPAYATAAMPAVAVALPPAGIPQLPNIARSQPTQAAASPFAFSPTPAQHTAPPTTSHRKQKKAGGVRRFMSWAIVLGVIGGAVYAGVTYGPDLMNRTEGDPTANEPDAPLAFPPSVPMTTPARTVSFLVERPAEDGSTLRYEMTSDFETGVGRMLVDRATMPDIEVLAVFDVANLRQADQPNWYSMPRGQFPLAAGSDRASWVRTVDEYFPAAMRQFVTIEHASESMIGTEAMRHLVVTVDTAGIAASATIPATDPLTGLPVAPPPPTSGEFVVPPSVTGTQALEPVTLEMWVDSNGLIRKLAEPPSMGGETITVTSLSPEAFNPTFPAPEAVTSLTAEQLVEFAL